MSPTAETLIHALHAFADPVRAVYDRHYHKSTREHWGITAPHLDAVIKPYVKPHPVPTLLQVAQELWHTQIFDLMIAAARLLGQKYIPASEELWQLITTFLRDVDGWALEDTLAPAAWKCLLHTPTLLDEIERWTVQEQLWMRRAALIYTLPYAKPGYDPERMLIWMGQYASDPAWFIQKAIGWWLRELGKHNPERVIHFLTTHWHTLRGVARKEATRKLAAVRLQQLR